MFSSVVFENASLDNVVFRGATLLNASFARASLRRVRFEQCDMGEPQVDDQTQFSGVELVDCELRGLRLVHDDEEEEREYAPSRVRMRLEQMGVRIIGAQDTRLSESPAIAPDTPLYRATQRLLRMFQRTTVVTDLMIESRAHTDRKVIYGEVIPLMERHGILAQKPWQGGGRQHAWVIQCRVDDLLTAEEVEGNGDLNAFWEDLRQQTRPRSV